MKITPNQSQALVRARLGRQSQDNLESAVVLEAWGGVRSSVALDISEKQVVHHSNHSVQLKNDQVIIPPQEIDPTYGVGLFVTLLATTAWIAALAHDFDPKPVEFAWLIAVPLARTLQGVMHRRYLARSKGLERVRQDLRNAVMSVALLCVLVFSTVRLIPDDGPLVGALAVSMTMIWICSVVAVYRGWAFPFTVLLALGVGIGFFNSPSETVLIPLFISIATAVAALMTTAPSRRRPTPMKRVLPTAIYCAGSGFLIVLNFVSARHLDSYFYVLALLPPFIGSYWAGKTLRSFWRIIPLRLSSTSSRGNTDLAGVSKRIFEVAIVRYLLAAVGLSVGLIFTAPKLGQNVSTVSNLLASLIALGVISLFAEILDSFGHAYRAAVCLWVALSVAFLLQIVIGWGNLPAILAAMVVMLSLTFNCAWIAYKNPEFSLARPS